MRSSILTAILYILFGIIFTFFAIQQVLRDGWGWFVYLLIFIATIDFVSGFRALFFHFYHKNKKNNQ